MHEFMSKSNMIGAIDSTGKIPGKVLKKELR
jgi:hypothetical protein